MYFKILVQIEKKIKLPRNWIKQETGKTLTSKSLNPIKKKELPILNIRF